MEISSLPNPLFALGPSPALANFVAHCSKNELLVSLFSI
jgi:hypothetical protein